MCDKEDNQWQFVLFLFHLTDEHHLPINLFYQEN